MPNLRIVLAVVLLAVITALASAAVSPAAEPVKPETTPPPAPDAQAVKSAPANGPNEAIGVHGHWVIEIRNPDGTLATRREFNNALTADGQNLIADVLSHAIGIGLWTIRLDGTPSPCALQCVITEPGAVLPPGASSPASKFSIARTLTLPPSLPPKTLAGPLRLIGNITATANGSITGVATGLGHCPPATPPATCAGTTQSNAFPFPAFTAVTIPALSVSTGQQVLIGVTLTFATAPSVPTPPPAR